MSPISPISPLSPMDISPVTLASPLSPSSIIELSLHPNSELTLPTIPPTPVICPSIQLPRLQTDLPIESRHHRRMTSSPRFVLLTPSPLTLNGSTPSSLYSSPQTAVLVPVNGRTFGIAMSPHSPVVSTSLSGMSLSLSVDVLPGTSPASSASSGSPGQTPIRSPMVGNTIRRERNTPSLKRENAMERLERMCVDMEMEAEVEIPVIPRPATAEQQTAPPNQSTTIPTTARPPTRSPIHRPHHHRRRTTRPTSTTTTTKTHTAHPTQTLSTVATYLAHPLVPLISISTGLPHPRFPRTLLHYHLLTHDNLDALARHYHQTLGAGRERWMYPCPIGWGKVWCGNSAATTNARSRSGSVANGRKRRRLADLETKRRRWGRFIGLRGCESPVNTGGDGDGDEVRIRVGNNVGEEQEEGERLVQRMEREWRDALRRAEEEGRVGEKIWGRRF